MMMMTINFLASHLNNCTSYICHNGFDFKTFTVSSGVPQELNLWPFLLNFSVNYLFSNVSCRVLAYTDELKIYTKLSTASVLQRDHNVTNNWCFQKKRMLSINNCVIVTYTTKTMPIDAIFLVVLLSDFSLLKFNYVGA